uniref:Uncharacterized protein n=1 Tax=Pseudo-nitzschia australis TaxID=44445 RepID=A0A7S4AS80_9STRA
MQFNSIQCMVDRLSTSGIEWHRIASNVGRRYSKTDSTLRAKQLVLGMNGVIEDETESYETKTKYETRCKRNEDETKHNNMHLHKTKRCEPERNETKPNGFDLI